MKYSEIYKCDTLNGIGHRVVLFVNGCSHHCYNCHNKATWDCNYGNEYTKEVEDRIISLTSKPYINGITLSGGDPLHENNLYHVNNLIDRIKQLGNKDIWLYTGYKINELDDDRLKIVKKVDYIIDGKYIDKLKDLSLKFRGSSNQRIYKVTNGKFIDWSEKI